MNEWWWTLLGVAALVVVIDRVAVWCEARGWIHWRKVGRGGAVGGMFGELMNVFQPSRQITVTETERQRNRVDAAETGSGSDIDLDANRVTIVLPPDPGPDAAPPAQR